jgi:DNA-binding XRE family transcriptional regulator
MSERDHLDELIERFSVEDPDLPVMVDALTGARLMVRRLEELRERAGLTQEEVARRVGTTQSAIARLERSDGDPRLSTIVKYAAIVGCVVELRPAPTRQPSQAAGQ